MYETICDILHREMDVLEEKYADGKTAMNSNDLDHIYKIAHALKCLATYEAMKASETPRRERYGYDKYRRY